jgi:hypothetical protein
MSRRIAALVALLVVSFVIGVSACSSSATEPTPVRADVTCHDWASNGTCLH